MKKMLLPCLLATLGYAGWHHYKVTQQGNASRQAEQAQAGQQHVEQPRAEPPHAELPPVAATTPAPTAEPAAPTPAPVASATPTPRVAPAGTFMKEELLAAINKDARESSLEKLLGTPNSKESTDWTALYIWTGKLDTGSNTPESFAVEVAPYNHISLVVGIYDPASHSTASLPWRAKVEADHKHWVQVWFDEQAATAKKKAQPVVYRQPPRDSQVWSRAEQSQYVSPLSQPAVRVGSGSSDQPIQDSTGSERVTGNVAGHGRTKADAYADAMSQLRAAYIPGKVPSTGGVRFEAGVLSNGDWVCHIDEVQNH